MFKNILLATDGSAHAKRAAVVAADIAATYGARLTLMTVMSPFMMLDDVEAAPQARRLKSQAKNEVKRLHQIIPDSESEVNIHAYVPALPSLTHALGDAILDEAARAAVRRKIKPGKITRVIVDGDAATQILKQATKAKASLIVMGTRGLSNFRGALIGGVSNKVIHSAKCATLVVK